MVEFTDSLFNHYFYDFDLFEEKSWQDENISIETHLRIGS